MLIMNDYILDDLKHYIKIIYYIKVVNDFIKPKDLYLMKIQ